MKPRAVGYKLSCHLVTSGFPMSSSHEGVVDRACFVLMHGKYIHTYIWTVLSLTGRLFTTAFSTGMAYELWLFRLHRFKTRTTESKEENTPPFHSHTLQIVRLFDSTEHCFSVVQRHGGQCQWPLDPPRFLNSKVLHAAFDKVRG